MSSADAVLFPVMYTTAALSLLANFNTLWVCNVTESFSLKMVMYMTFFQLGASISWFMNLQDPGTFICFSGAVLSVCHFKPHRCPITEPDCVSLCVSLSLSVAVAVAVALDRPDLLFCGDFHFVLLRGVQLLPCAVKGRGAVSSAGEVLPARIAHHPAPVHRRAIDAEYVFGRA